MAIGYRTYMAKADGKRIRDRNDRKRREAQAERIAKARRDQEKKEAALQRAHEVKILTLREALTRSAF